MHQEYAGICGITKKAVENGRNLYQNIKYAIQFLLSGNFGAILAVLCASLAGLPVPFAPVHLLFINLLTDSLPAIALGVEPHSSEVMNEKPRSADELIPVSYTHLDWRLLYRKPLRPMRVHFH